MKIGLLQINTTVGDLAGNRDLILRGYQEAVELGADIVLTPELALTGYPPQDLVFKTRFVPATLEMLEQLRGAAGRVPLVVGYVDRNNGPGNPFFNAAAVLQQGAPPHVVHKTLLPTYDVFDEDRYFQPGENSAPVVLCGRTVGITICEDIWPEEHLHRALYHVNPVQSLAAQGADIILNLSASPFHLGKQHGRVQMLTRLARKHGTAFVYCNAVGGNDQILFDGASLVVNPSGDVVAQLPAFSEAVRVVDLEGPAVDPVILQEPEEIYSALSLGLADYFRKCGFKSAVLGLSGGIDSAVTACIAVEALGAENVTGITMPTHFSSEGSVADSLELARNLGIQCLQIPIQPVFEVMQEQLRPFFEGLPEDTTEENLQPRIRAMTLMAFSNKYGHLLLTTGNKSELAVGYCTLYGDMAGGLAVISDVPKTKIYKLAGWINAVHAPRTGRTEGIIPRATIDKPPSAELKPDQKDQDTLPPYDILDGILELYVEQHLGVAEIVDRGFSEETVRWVQRRVDLNEYKREQAAPGLRVTSKAFGAGRRMPVAQKFVG